MPIPGAPYKKTVRSRCTLRHDQWRIWLALAIGKHAGQVAASWRDSRRLLARQVRQEDARWLAPGGAGPAGARREARHSLQKLDLHHRDTRADHRELPGRRVGEIEETMARMRPTIIDPHTDRAPIRQVRHHRLRAQGHSPM